MTREELIDDAAFDYLQTLQEAPIGMEELTKIFKDAVRWADSNPAWRMCEEELPGKPCMCVCHDEERMFFAEWVDETPNGGLSGWDLNGLTNQPIAWMPFPIPPKFNPESK